MYKMHEMHKMYKSDCEIVDEKIKASKCTNLLSILRLVKLRTHIYCTPRKIRYFKLGLEGRRG